MAVFRYQAEYNPLYRTYVTHLGVRPEQVSNVRRIPFMPIGFFKNHAVLTGFSPDKIQPETITFTSSGTTGQQTSKHYLFDADLYETVSIRLFEQLYGPLTGMPVLALLPSYLERNNSSLVYMVQRFMQESNSPLSGFFLNNYDELTGRLRQLAEEPTPPRTLLIGVTFGLLDWVESGLDLSFLAKHPNLIVMETGGMKGRRKELLREEVHQLLGHKLGASTIHSEYGMTELLSQAYSLGAGVFRPSATLRVYLRDINDPFCIYDDAKQTGERRTGGINVIDLANVDSCAFIETQDLGRYTNESGQFQVIGRFDNSDVRGCNLLVV